jgi:hypothetical protein
MFQHCENRCGRIFDDGGRPGQFFCSPECRAERHAQLLRVPCSEAKTLAPAPRPTMSVREAWVERGNVAPEPDEVDRYAEMLKRVLLAPPRQDLSPPRPKR